MLLFIAAGFCINAEADADEKAGQKWPMAQRVSFGDIDHSDYNQLLQKHVDSDRMVDYQSWHANPADRETLKKHLAQFGTADAIKPATRAARLAYWINAYNALMIQRICEFIQPPVSAIIRPS